jgi:hypothetical protein
MGPDFSSFFSVLNDISQSTSLNLEKALTYNGDIFWWFIQASFIACGI